MALRIYEVTIEMVRELRPIMEGVGRRDRSLADQLRRAAACVPLNVNEGMYSLGGNARARFHNALGSTAEVRACLDVAEAMGYVEPVNEKLRDRIDHIMATLHKLARR